MNILVSSLVAVVAAVGGYFGFVSERYDNTLFSQGESLGAVSYPTSLDNFTNPSATDRTNVVSHSQQHSDANDAIEALQAKVGVNNSAVTTSFDFKLSGVTTGDKAVSLTGSEVLTNKTLTSPLLNSPTIATGTLTFTNLQASTTLNGTTTINGVARLNLGSDATGDIFYRNALGNLARLPIGSSNEVLKVSGGLPVWATDSTASATTSTMVLQPQPGASGSSCSISPTDTSAVVSLQTVPFDINVSSVSVRTGTNVATTSPLDIVLYRVDGQSQVLSVTTAGGHSASSIVTTNIATTTISAGTYYVSVNQNSGSLFQLCGYDYANAPFTSTGGLFGDVGSRPIYIGTLTISSGVPATTFSPTSVTDAVGNAVALRFN